MRSGQEKLSYHGMRQCWVFNRAMIWLDKSGGLDGTILCYSSQSPLPLTGKRQVSRWHVGPGNELSETDDQFTRLTKKNVGSTWDHACLPPLQFSIEQHRTAAFEVREATHPWQFVAIVKGRSGPPLFVSPWQTGAGKLSVNLLELYRGQGYENHFAEMVFFIAVWTKDPQEQAAVEFRLSLTGGDVIVPSLPIIRTAKRAETEGVPLCAVVLDGEAKRLGRDVVDVTASIGQTSIKLAENGQGIWKAVARGVPPGDHEAELRATWKAAPRKSVATRLSVRVTDGQFVSYDPKLRLLMRAGKPLGPITGSYRGQSVFKDVGTAGESLLHGQEQWEAAIQCGPPGPGGLTDEKPQPNYGFHFWESLTPRELDDDYAYVARCGWHMIHLCSAWLWWPRFDAAGRLSPFCAEQIDAVCRAAGRHGLFVHLAVSHYPLGLKSPPYAQYLEAGDQRSDYGNPILLTWEERIVENERIVFEQIRRAVDWRTPFQRPPLAIRVDGKLMPVAGRQPLFRYEKALSQIPLEACYVWEDEPVPPGTVATLDARQPFVAPAFVSEGGTLPDELKSRLPLILPAGWAANYSWSDDRRTLLAFLRGPNAAGRDWNTAEGGDYTCVDTTLRIEKDSLVDTWETRCLKPGKIQLRIYRPEGNELVWVGESEMVEMAAPGRCRFTLKEPIAARQGDLLGFYIPRKDTEIAARLGGRMLFAEASAAERSAVASWQTEAKSADLAVFRKEDPARPQTRAPQAGAGLVLQNFPSEEFTFRLFDLATRRPVFQDEFRQTRRVASLPPGDHFVLLALPAEPHGKRDLLPGLWKEGHDDDAEISP